MMCRRLLQVVALASGVQAGTAAQPAQGESAKANPLLGAWLITETSVTDQNGTTVNRTPEPGIYIFTQRHFSNMLIPGSPRALFGRPATQQERLNACDNFIADSGTYEYTQTTLTARNIIAKVPNVMPPHSSGALTYQWRLDGDRLTLTLRSGWAPRDGAITYKLSRLE
jgi:hypothetical protein